MSTDIARLGFAVNSAQAEQGADRLDRLTGAAQRAEAATKGLGVSSTNAGRMVVAANDNAAASAGRVTAATNRARDALGRFVSTSNSASNALAWLRDRASSAWRQLTDLQNIVRNVIAATAIRAIVGYADAWSDMQSRVGAAIRDMDAAPAMMQRMVDIANASYSPLDQTVEVYSRNVAVLADLGRGATEAADFTESLNHALVITATRGERAASVQNALSKAMAVGRLQADGLETILANGGAVAEALAAELGTTVSGLRKMASEGKITGDVIARALIGRLDEFRERAAEMPATVGDAFTRLQTNLTAFIGQMDKSTGASQYLSAAIMLVANNLDTIARVAVIAGTALALAFAPAILSAAWGLTAAIGTGLVGAVKLLTAAIMANPLGALAIAISTVLMAIWQFRDEIKQAFGIDVVEIVKGASNSVIGIMVGGYNAIRETWSMLPAAFADIFARAMNGAIDRVQRGINAIRGALRGIPFLGKQVAGDIDLSGFKFNVTGAAGDAIATAKAAMQKGLSGDYVGGLFGSGEMGPANDNTKGGKPPPAPPGDSENAYTRALESLKQTTVALNDQAATLGMTEAAAARYTTAQELLRAAAEAKLPITAALTEQINGAAQAYYEATLKAEGARLEMENLSPFEAMRMEIQRLDEMLAAGAISWETYADAKRRALGDAHVTMASYAKDALGIMGQLFEDNKAIAIANAIVSTYEGVAKSLSKYPMPFAAVMAAAHLALGVKQVMAIKSTNKSSKSASASGGGGGAAGASGASGSAQAEAPQQQAVNFTIYGDSISYESMEDFVKRYNTHYKDGGAPLITITRASAA